MALSKHIAAALTACTALTIGQAGAAEPLKIGFSAPLTGSQAVVGQDQLDGFNLALEQAKGQLGGRPVTLFKEDDQLKPEIGSQIVRKFVEKDKVDAIVGMGFSNVFMAGLKTVVDSGVVAIGTNAGPSPVAGAGCAPNVFSVAWQNDGSAEAVGQYVKSKGYQRVVLMAPNYQAGKDMMTGFKRFYQGQPADELYTQVGQTDYSAEIAQVQAAKADAVFVFYPGGMGVNFVKQFSQAGLLGKLPMFSVFTVDGTTMPALRDAAVGSVYGAMWDAALQSPENRQFVEAFQAKYKRVPSEYAATGYDAARLLDVAVRKVNGHTADRKAFAAAVKAAGAEFRSVRGPFSFNRNNMPVQNYYMFQVLKQGGQVLVKEQGVALDKHADAYVSLCKRM
ncbi:ABC transporter substrate-binding protein [Herbaspirillum rubrisubalbicans]|uniref:ABC transporter substrate-binding protein n=1 Tax=Herbaspirillum rubrisubalbicans TaxID=80842 RepID=UPI001558542D|nr:ABC transporter substrate-binding protein [Herbaspirillum rubrisubalbicans]NQE48939.1 ABC transporter substrate-binding protein [Herbaspirillum rubrisubalbicans]